MERIKQKFIKFRYKGVLAIVFVFFVISFILFTELSGIRYTYAGTALDFMPDESLVTKAEAVAKLQKNALFLYDGSKKDNEDIMAEFILIMNDMKIGRDEVDLSVSSVPDFYNYEYVIVFMSDLEPLGNDVITLSNYVRDGGQVLFPLTIDKNPYSSVIEHDLGILDSSYEYHVVEKIYVEPEFMLGGGKSFDVPSPYESARVVQLSKDVKVYAIDKENNVPLVWKTNYGKGAFVVDNIGLIEKAYRGFYTASLSLLTDVYIYPVINGACYYLDDFPSQIPSGNSEYIQRDYNTSIRDFYINIWWQDMMNLADKYGMKYTGLAIESYDDHVDGTTDAEPDTGTFLNFGNMLLRKGGELGYHGYNHQPLCFDNCDYQGLYDYKTWESYSAMKKGFDHLIDFCDTLFPDIEMSVYVPPSNLLSKEGRALLAKEYPHIKTISGIYFADAHLDFSCTQEYDVAEDGIIDQPRIISGCDLTDYMKMAAISELNLHLANNYFTHPDDALDPDRGAELGWEKLCQSFDDYLNWMYTAVPNIRNFTGSEMSAAVSRFVAVSPKREIFDDHMTVKIEGFYDEAQFLMRFNNKTPGEVKGGELTHYVGDIYLLVAESDTVEISFK